MTARPNEGGLIPTSTVREAMEQLDVPGVVVGIISGDHEETATFGITSVDNPLEVDRGTRFQMGSISKTFVAAAIMRLVELGRLDLDEPVKAHVPELRLADQTVERGVSARHLLNHTGGWFGGYWEDVSRGDDALELIVQRLDRLEQLTPLGEVFGYSNSGFHVAGRLIEVLSGLPFESAIRDLILDPLGMDGTCYFAEDVITHRFVVGHGYHGAVAEPWGLPRTAAPAGGLISTVEDLFKYARFQWGEPGDVLTQGALAEMHRPQVPVGNPLPGEAAGLTWVFGEAVGLSWFVFELAGHRFITHSGGTNGQLTRILIAPDDRFALVVLTNHDSGEVVADRVQEVVLQNLFGAELPQVPRIERKASELDEYAGVYWSPPRQATISIEGNLLRVETIHHGGFPDVDTPPLLQDFTTRAAFERDDAIVTVDPPFEGQRADFLRDPKGRVKWYRSGELYKKVR